MLDLQAATRLMGKSGNVGTCVGMAEGDELATPPDEAMDRIDAALDRIAARRTSPPVPTPGDADQGGVNPDTAIIAARLDGLITRLREALAIAAG